jgi:hypothetical protein
MNSSFIHINSNSPISSEFWKNLSDIERLNLVKAKSDNSVYANKFIILQAKIDGQIIISLLDPVGPHIRGTLLLDYESYLKSELDESLTIWLEPLGDKNSLRNLRGIEVKKA